MIKYGKPITAEKVSTFENTNELLAHTYSKFVELHDLEKDEKIINSKYGKKWFWFVFF